MHIFPRILNHIITPTLDKYLCKGRLIIFEVFRKKHIAYIAKNEKVGKPQDIESLFSVDEIESDFKTYDVIELKETEIILREGLYHNGQGSVIRFVG